MKALLLGILICLFGIARSEAKEHLFVVPARSNIAAKSPVVIDVYLHNEGPGITKLPPMQYLVAEWVVDDTTGKRLGRSGGSTRISGYKIPNVAIQAGEVLHRKLTLNVDAEPGDLVRVKVSLGGRRGVESKAILLYCSSKSRRSG